MADTIHQTALLQFAHEPAGLALLFENRSRSPSGSIIYSAFSSVCFTSRGTDWRLVEDPEGVSLYLDTVVR
jgi:hypothetical protein